jgi:YggT family protein
MLNLLLHKLVGAVLTLYMLAILLRWLGPWIDLDLHRGPARWIPKITDPLVGFIRKHLPPLGPMDWAPLAAVVLLWIVRLFVVQY